MLINGTILYMPACTTYSCPLLSVTQRQHIPINLSLLHTIFQMISFNSSSLCLSGAAVALLAKFCLDRFCHSLIVRQQFCSSPLQNQISSTTKGHIYKRRRYLKKEPSLCKLSTFSQYLLKTNI